MAFERPKVRKPNLLTNKEMLSTKTPTGVNFIKGTEFHRASNVTRGGLPIFNGRVLPVTEYGQPRF